MTSKPQREFPETIDDRIAEMESARRELISATAGLDPRKAETRPATDRWSVSEILYHLHMAEMRITERLAAILSSGERGERPSDDDLRSEWERIISVVLNREPPITAPALIQPTGIPALADAVDGLRTSREALLKVVEAHGEDGFGSIAFPHPLPAVGVVSGLGWLSIIACHDARHLDQIREII